MKIDPAASFIQFVYPFQFEPARFDTRCVRIQGASWPKPDGTLPIWEKSRFPPEDLLSHVEGYLNPEPASSPQGELGATALLWKLHNSALQSPHGLAAGGKQSKARWVLEVPDGDIPFRVHTCHLSMFRVGVGLLTVSAAPEEESVEAWLDFLHFFRFARSHKGVFLRLNLSDGTPFFPPAAGVSERHSKGTGDLADIFEMLLTTGAENGEPQHWWKEIFIPSRTLPFAALYIDGAPETDREHLLYRARSFFPAKRDVFPAEFDVGSDPHGTYRYAENIHFCFSLDGGAFVAFDAPSHDFFRKTLPQHLREQYLLIFLMALHQRFALLRLSGEVASGWPMRPTETPTEDTHREELFRDVRDALLIFTARGHFTQIMQRANHHRCYQEWQKVFQISELHREVSEEVREMHNYLLMKKTERSQQLNEERTRRERAAEKAADARAEALQTRISILGLLIGGPALVIGFLGINIAGVTSSEGLTMSMAAQLGFGGGLSLGLLVWVILWLFRHKS